MKISKVKLISMLIISVVLIAVLAVGGTMAWLTAQSSDLVNTFTVGNIAISLAEPLWGDNAKLIPGGTLPKDPTVTVTANSEDCYVFVCVENIIPNTVATLDGVSTAWASVGTATNKTLYVYGTTTAGTNVPFATTNTVLPALFTGIKCVDTATNAELAAIMATGSLKNTITISAYAHQSANTGYAAALTAANAKFGTS